MQKHEVALGVLGGQGFDSIALMGGYFKQPNLTIGSIMVPVMFTTFLYVSILLYIIIIFI